MDKPEDKGTEVVLIDTYAAPLTMAQRLMVKALHERGRMDRDQLRRLLYPTHEVAYANTRLRMVMTALRNRLAPMGWTVTNNKGGRGILATYELERLEHGVKPTLERASRFIIRRDPSQAPEYLSVLQEWNGDGEVEEEEPDSADEA